MIFIAFIAITNKKINTGIGRYLEVSVVLWKGQSTRRRIK